MATKRLSPKLLRSLNSARTLNSATSASSVVSPLNLVNKPDASSLPQSPSVSLSSPGQLPEFGDGERLFSSIPTKKLLNYVANLHLMALDPVVDLGMAVMRSRFVEGNRIVREAVLAVVKRTVYGHFCAGEDLEEASRTLQGLWDEGLRGILDYGLEDAGDNSGCDQNLTEFLKTVEMTSHLPPSSVSFACVKITAICPISLLERVSDLLRWEQKDPSSLHLPWKHQSLPILSDRSPLYHTKSRPPPLTPTEEQDLELAHKRLWALCERCVGANLPLLIDAEYTSVQPSIDYMAYAAAVRFNVGDRPFVYGTIQTYLRDSKERLALTTEAAEREGIRVGFKLVRGAYITRETQLASSLGVDSPVHPSIRETHACYNECAAFMLEKAARGSGWVVLATHNLESGKIAAAKALELGIGRGNEKVQFAQLKGMAEGLSLGLRNAGFNVSKYLPFGPVDKVVPYLMRRAEENRGLLSASTFDRRLMREELKRRLKAAIVAS